MIRRHVLAALAVGIEVGSDDAARDAIAHVDWIVRGLARRRLERALIDAALAANEFAVDAEAMRHVQRVAALAVRGRRGIDAGDRARVESAYGAVPAPRRARVPVATLAAAAIVAGVVGATLWYVDTRPGPPSRLYTRPAPPPAAGAFRDGGVPLTDPELVNLFRDDFTELVVATDAARRGTTDAARVRLLRALRDAPAIVRRPTLVPAWRALLDALDGWVRVPAEGRALRAAAKDLRARARAFSDQLAALGLGYYLEADAWWTAELAHVAIFVYRVEEVAFVVAGAKPERVLNLRRIDHLNLTRSLLGMQSDELGDPVVLLDPIDTHVATEVLPVLAPDAPFPLGDDFYQRSDGRELALAIGTRVRGELAAALGRDAEAATAIAALLAERARLVDDWRAILERRGLRLARTDSLFLPAGLLDQLDEVPKRQRARAAAIDDELAGLEAPRLASRCHQLVVATVRRHEAQHGLDDGRATPLRYPAALAEHVGAREDGDGQPRPFAERANFELSAYTSQIANDPRTPQLALWGLEMHAFTKPSWGSAESYVAVTLLEGLARQLGDDLRGRSIHDGEIDRLRLARLGTVVLAVSDDRLRAAARALWAELYGEPLVPIVDR